MNNATGSGEARPQIRGERRTGVPLHQALLPDEQDLVDLAEARRRSKDGSARRARLKCRLSAQELAKPCGVATPTIYRWENGRRRPTGPGALTWVRLLRRLSEEPR